MEADTKKTVDNFESWKKRLKQVDEIPKPRITTASSSKARRFATSIRTTWRTAACMSFWPRPTWPRGEKPAATAELERYVHIGGRNPETLKQLAGQLTDAGNKKEAAEVLDRLNYIYPMDNEAAPAAGRAVARPGQRRGRRPRIPRGGRAQPAWIPPRRTIELARAYNAEPPAGPGRGRIVGGARSRARITGPRKSCCWN